MVQLPLWQARPVPQASLAQQGSPLPPQLLQVSVAVHTLPAAHWSPTSRHTVVEVVVSQQPLLQVSPEQQGCPFPPQPAQWPDDRHSSPVEHMEPEARHTRLPGSQQPLLHELPAQHGLPGVPHCWHTPRHTVPVSVQLAPYAVP